MKLREAIAWAALAAVGAGGMVVACQSSSARAIPAPAHRHVALMPRTVTGQAGTCGQQAQYDQELACYDPWGNPIFSVSHDGLIGSEGLCYMVTALDDYTHIETMQCWGSPAAFENWSKIPGILTCKVPGAWFEPAGIWACEPSGSAGAWVKKVSW